MVEFNVRFYVDIVIEGYDTEEEVRKNLTEWYEIFNGIMSTNGYVIEAEVDFIEEIV